MAPGYSAVRPELVQAGHRHSSNISTGSSRQWSPSKARVVRLIVQQQIHASGRTEIARLRVHHRLRQRRDARYGPASRGIDVICVISYFRSRISFSSLFSGSRLRKIREYMYMDTYMLTTWCSHAPARKTQSTIYASQATWSH